ncbi:kinesin-like protein CG14535 isoform X2 [Rhodnius prolixus]|uniref:kinesin-like protein CG14535 isoform X2 n=1 Tax=Rhodnius prolixus TaxID=13249 RepID=UPI003D18A0FE
MDKGGTKTQKKKTSMVPVPSPRVPTPRPPLPPLRPRLAQARLATIHHNLTISKNYTTNNEYEEIKHDSWKRTQIFPKTVSSRGDEILYLSTAMYSLKTQMEQDYVIPAPGFHTGRHRQGTIATAILTRKVDAEHHDGEETSKTVMASPKLSMGSSPHRKKRLTTEAEGGFSSALAKHPPPIPPPLLRRLGSKEISGLGKVKVMLKVSGCSSTSSDTSLLNVDSRKRQVTLFDPASCGASSLTPEDRRLGVAAPKMFAFDAIFTEQEAKGELCATALTDVIHAVINGTDGCLFSFGHPRLGKTNTMVGSPESVSSLGVIPSAISWLYRSIADQKQRTGARFSVRVSAIEVAGPAYNLKDLLQQHAAECDQAPIYLCEGSLQNCCELRAPSPEKAAFYLDSALLGRCSEQSHLFYTLHVYQYSVAGKGGVAGGRSRLHLIDLGSCERSKGTGGLPLSAIGNVLLAIFNGQKHLPHREHKLTQQLKECMGSLTCHAAMIAHVSPEAANYTDTLTTVQLASRIHRMRRKRFKFMGTGGGVVAGEDVNRPGGSSDVDPSSSEQSADTVIYVGPTEETDGEHPPVYIPSLNSGDNRCAMNKALRGSLVEQKLKTISKSVPASPQKSIPEEKSMHRKQTKPNSTKSSPVRTLKPTTSAAREEQWIDGPRVLKSRVSEGRAIHSLSGSGGRDKRETWVDGPRLANGHSLGGASTPGNGASAGLTSAVGGSYGFMDTHKKNMIRKWVENQSILIGKTRHYREPSRALDEARGRGSGQEDDGGVTSYANHSLQPIHIPPNKGVPLEKLQCSGVEPEYDEDMEMEVEIIEVEEPEEPVPMQDCCLQVTEEDIALCMGTIENPLPEVDQEEHPLRILSQENLTVVSTFADSLSLVNDLDRILPKSSVILGNYNGWQRNVENHSDTLARKMAQYEQLSALHDLYNAKQRVNDLKPVARCQSLMFSEFFTGTAVNDFDVNSIASEPAYLPGENSKLCDNCKINLEVDTSSFYKYDPTRFHSYRKLNNLSSLRHPDGASNPNLRDVCKREPGNGAESIPKLDDEEEISVPPPLMSSMLSLNRESYEPNKSHMHNSIEISNGQLHDPGGKVQYCKADVERLDRGWNEAKKGTKLKDLRSDQQKYVKSEITSTRHRIFSPFGHSGLFEKRAQFQTNTSSSKTTNKSQAV